MREGLAQEREVIVETLKVEGKTIVQTLLLTAFKRAEHLLMVHDDAFADREGAQAEQADTVIVGAALEHELPTEKLSGFLKQETVEGVVAGEQVVEAAVQAGEDLRLDERVHGLQAAGADGIGEKRGGVQLEAFAKEAFLKDPRDIEQGDGRFALGKDVDEAVAAQSDKSLANRGAADAQLARKRLDPERRAGSKGQVHHGRAQLEIYFILIIFPILHGDTFFGESLLLIYYHNFFKETRYKKEGGAPLCR